MATNLVTMVMQVLTPDTVGRIAGALGLDRRAAQTAIGAAVPALLAELTRVAAQRGGPQKLLDAARQQTGTLNSFAKTVGTGGQSSLIEKGSQMLSVLLGDQEPMALAAAVGRYAGIGPSASGSLLAMLAPVVMATIAEQLGVRILDSSRIAGFLITQKDGIAAALPSGFRDQLGGTDLLDALGGIAGMTTPTADKNAQATARAVHSIDDAGRRAATAAASPNWVSWVVPALAIAGLLFYVFAKSH